MKSNKTPMYKMMEHSNDVILEDGRKNKNHKSFSKFTYEIPQNQKKNRKNKEEVEKRRRERKKNIEGWFGKMLLTHIIAYYISFAHVPLLFLSLRLHCVRFFCFHDSGWIQ